ncbi:hypothetical protein [Segatella salivae]|uniref:Uncharacterized protein n=1 Tax=Segatella salivae DSM 15606 TaxID=888832 RepID=E6MLP2_9BACT|nr:hypothetical protein [Segatella salivae]EFV05442.1 hypothetical protein HMPREF9420_0409 [Segatella salivae DSM 15606]
MKANKLQYSTREINRDFKIKVYGYTDEGRKVDMLVGVSGLIFLIGVEHANKQIERAWKSHSTLTPLGKQDCSLWP